MMKLLLRAIGDIVPHLLKKGTRSSQGYPPALPSVVYTCPSACAEELGLSIWVGDISLDRAVRVCSM